MTLHSAEEAGAAGRRGRVLGLVWLREDAYVQIHEAVKVKGSGVTREKYAYFLVVDGREVGGYERDPTHDPAEHRDCSSGVPHERQPAEAVSFKQAMEEAWDYLSRH